MLEIRMNNGPLIARRRTFSTAHFYEQKKFTPEQNRAVFGACYTPYGHGHNYTLEMFVEGPIDSETGLVVNVTDLDVILKKVTADFDHHHISFDVPAFRDVVPTTENLISHFFNEIEKSLGALHPTLKLNRVRLYETDEIWAEARGTRHAAAMPVQAGRSADAQTNHCEVTRQFVIRSIHHLENTAWTPEENRRVYGICYGTHGHHYKIQVTCRGPIDASTGMAVDRTKLDQILEREIRSKYDGVDLNKRFANTSCEALAVEFHKILEPRLSAELNGGALVKIGVQETRKNYFEFPPEG